ncbi:MAG: hypothetical protein HW410_793 [Nitrosarchaeum sp.]|nr:hypothetical protein [Nitrosarchaeum sp.]
MADPLINDVKDLLDKEKGDELILKQIFRACQNNEVISNYERNYVRKLAEKYLGRISYAEKKQDEEKSMIPELILSKPPSSQKIETLQTTQIPKVESKNTKLMIGIGGVIMAIIIIVGLSLTGTLNVGYDNTLKNPVGSTNLSIQTDLSEYHKGDIISINGRSNSSEKINLSIENQQGLLIWSEQINVKNDETFSTLVIAGGSGWEKSGIFIITAESDSETESNTFSFTG